MKHFKRSLAFGSALIAGSVAFTSSAYAAVVSVVPADLADSQTTMQGDIVAIGAVVIGVALAIMGVKAVKRIAS